jgi:hypothetical protein
LVIPNSMFRSAVSSWCCFSQLWVTIDARSEISASFYSELHLPARSAIG